MKTQKAPFPLRLDDEVREAAEKLAAQEKRSLNYQINELVKRGLKGLKLDVPSDATPKK